MAATGTSVFRGGIFTALSRDRISSNGSFKSRPISVLNTRRIGVSTSVNQAASTSSPETTTTPSPSSLLENGAFEKNHEEAATMAFGVGMENGSRIYSSQEDMEERGSLKEFFEQSIELIRSDGGPPRWFSPLESSLRMKNSPLLLFLPGIDGVGLGLIKHHRRLGKIFDVWCLHIPVRDRTPFTDLLKLVEKTIKAEHHRSPNSPIYLVGESLGACLALSVAARNPDIDLVLILSNPATCFSKSPLQPVVSLLEVIPESLQTSLPYIMNLLKGDSSSRLAMANMQKGLQQIAGELSQDLSALASQFFVLADMLPIETLIWKLQMLKSASSYSNSRLHAVKAETLVLCSGRDQFLPSVEEGGRLRRHLPKCEIRKFDNNGHFLFLEDGVDLVSAIKGAGFYRRSKNIDYVSDFIPPSPSECRELSDSFRWFVSATSPVMFSTQEDGKIVRGLAGLPEEGPVLFVGYHMLLGLELAPLVTKLLSERNILVRGMAHPMMFNQMNGSLPDSSNYDSFRTMGAVPVSGKNFFKLLSSKAHVLLYPGGVREALHRKGETYKLFWPEQSEFVRMAARFGAKIVPFGAVGEDDIGEVVFDYDDLMKIPYFKNQIKQLTNEVSRLRIGMNGEVGNQDVHLPGILPKIPGRFYYYFGKPIETQGRKEELQDREKSQELYLQVKGGVENCLAYLVEKRESDPYRQLLPRLIYQATHGFSSEVPTFEI